MLQQCNRTTVIMKLHVSGQWCNSATVQQSNNAMLHQGNMQCTRTMVKQCRFIRAMVQLQCIAATVQQCNAASGQCMVKQCIGAMWQHCNSVIQEQCMHRAIVRNSATMQCCNCATVQCCIRAMVKQCIRAIWQCCNSAMQDNIETVYQGNGATAQHATVQCCIRAMMKQCIRAMCQCCNSAIQDNDETVYQGNDAKVQHCNNGTVQQCNGATVYLDLYIYISVTV